MIKLDVTLAFEPGALDTNTITGNVEFWLDKGRTEGMLTPGVAEEHPMLTGVHVKPRAAPVIATERLRAALKTILEGSEINGRWIDQIDHDAIEGGEEGKVPEGYYDDGETEGNEDDDPEGDLPPMPDDVGAEDHDRLLLKDGEWLRPALWEEYDKEDQDNWLGSVVGICEAELAATAIEPQLETPRMLMLSTGHLTLDTAQRINADQRRVCQEPRDEDLPLLFRKGDDGWFIPIIGDVAETLEDRPGCPADLIAIRKLAEANGCTWIMLDRDGPVVDALPSYDW